MLWDLLTELNRKGLTILLTTHYMEEADQLCGRTAIIDHGKLLALDSPAQLKRSVPGGYLVGSDPGKRIRPLGWLRPDSA